MSGVHSIADNLEWFGEKKNIEQIAQERGIAMAKMDLAEYLRHASDVATDSGSSPEARAFSRLQATSDSTLEFDGVEDGT